MTRAIVLLFLSAITNLCLAGTVLDIGVTINTETRYASGALSHVRHSDDSRQYIGCYYSAYEGWSSAYCLAADDNGAYASCFTGNSKMTDVIQSLRSGSNLQFRWNANGQCTSIQVDNRSDYINLK